MKDVRMPARFHARSPYERGESRRRGAPRMVEITISTTFRCSPGAEEGDETAHDLDVVRRQALEDEAEEKEVEAMLYLSPDELQEGSEQSTEANGSRSAASSSYSRPQNSPAIPPENSILTIEKNDHKLKKYETSMTSFRTVGPHAIPSPPPVPGAKPHDIFMHCYPGGRTIWRATANKNKRWIVLAKLEEPHPLYKEYRLHVSKDNWARWVLKKTLTTYKGREKKGNWEQYRGAKP